MIKVEHTRTHVTIPKGKSMYHDVLVTDAELVLVEVSNGRFAKLIDTTDGEVTFILQPNDDAFKLDKSVKECHIIPIKPILISRTEKIEVGDWYYDELTKLTLKKSGWCNKEQTVHQSESGTTTPIQCAFKILALPEHFSPQQLQDIVDGKLKEGRLVIECATYTTGTEQNPQRIVERKDTEGNGFFVGEYDHVKLNPHITIYPPVEEKMYTREEVKTLLEPLWHRANQSGINGNPPAGSSYTQEVFNEWFEQNVK